ncbi:hypothetical protein AGDE_06170 [Angomonas deanei]|uniref:Uncharacterized protein n=1 Tax=Angomonas deanei TaxID=59799 RepID=S9U7S6_9TRYP|nr:hypothetical protein AGDE_11084 [Angomonas deanei]EPY37764.1 hypothetical protein AGDE_06170 [Angomonas deanei]CAD2216661.1 hypothetical protein, conserved [Angomonas deanei]|eukprot:EPY26802.1 hypothetical protein AGDE_11084 [Angomonas deanei]
MEDSYFADANVRRELDRMNEAVERYGVQLDTIENELAVIDEENQNDDVNRQIIEYEAAMSANFKDIPAEDALDNIVRMQNQLKIVKRRNQLLAKENAIQQKQLRDRANMLSRTSTELDNITEITGWHGEFHDVDMSTTMNYQEAVHDMTTLAAKVRQELNSAKVIIKKKENAIVKLQTDAEQNKELEKKLQLLYNDIRVKQRDTREAEAKLQRMIVDDSNVERALVKRSEQQDSVAASVLYMENDKEFLSDAVAEMKVICRRQDNVVKAQLARQQQLQARLDQIMKALREMKLAKEFERNVAKSALVPSASREEPEDVEQILPDDEHIPIDTYRLLYKDNEMMRTSVARKNMLVLEKESAIQALESKLAKYIDSHNASATQGDSMQANKNAELTDLMIDLQEQHKAQLAEIEELSKENRELKLEYNKRAQNAKAKKAKATNRSLESSVVSKTSVRRAK